MRSTALTVLFANLQTGARILARIACACGAAAAFTAAFGSANAACASFAAEGRPSDASRSDDSTRPPGEDAASGSVEGGAEGGPTEGGSPDSGACTVLIDDTFSGQEAGWDKLGKAAFEAGQVRLTARATGSTGGAIWWKNALTFTGTLHVVLDFSVDSSSVTSGDGITIGWVSTPYTLGGQGQSFGLCSTGMSGVGAAADTRDSDLLVMDGIAASCQTNGGVFSVALVPAMQMVVDIRATGITASLNGKTGSRLVAIPKTGWFGITAATGNGQSAHVATSVKVMSCP